MKLASCTDTFGYLIDTPRTVDLPVSTGNPTEIVLDASNLKQAVAIHIHAYADFYMTRGAAGTAASGEGNNRIADNNTRGKYPAGSYQFPIVGMRDSLYIRSQDAAAAEGIVYWFIGGSRS